MMAHQRVALGVLDMMAVAVGVVLSVPFFLVALSPFIIG